MFSLRKTGDIWTLSYEVSPLRRLLLIGAGIAGLGVAMFQSINAGGFDHSTFAIFVGVLLCLAVMAYWVASDAASTVVFDLAQRNVRVHCERPGFGAVRSYAFSDVAALRALNRSGETVDSWEAWLELRGGSRIRLGRESEDRNERVRSYLADIRDVTGIPGA